MAGGTPKSTPGGKQANLFSFFRRAEPAAASTATASNAPTPTAPSVKSDASSQAVPSSPVTSSSTTSLSETIDAPQVPSTPLSTPIGIAAATPPRRTSSSSFFGSKPATPALVEPNVAPPLKRTASPSSVVAKDTPKSLPNDGLVDSDDGNAVASTPVAKKRRLQKLSTQVTPLSVSKSKSKPSGVKKRVVVEEDEEWDEDSEAQASEDSGDDGSVFTGESDDDDDSNLDSDGESSAGEWDEDSDEDKAPKKKRPAPKSRAATAAAKKTRTIAGGSKPPLVPGSARKSTVSANSMTVNGVTSGASTPQHTPARSFGSPDATGTPREMPSTPTTNASGIPLPEGVLPIGSHEHNFFDFLKPPHRRDGAGHPSTHPEYNPRTLTVPEKFLSEQTPAMAQWWRFKAFNMDTVLFFKVGKFYELFHMDADVGATELDMLVMKGSKAHVGFPEVSYGKFSSALVARGYRVARIEQTETPEQLKERNEAAAKGKKDKVVKRELCSVMTRGTRTYCHLDDLSLLQEAGPDAVCTSALLCLKEAAVEDELGSQSRELENDDEGLLPVIEIGLALVDTVLGTITLAQFQDDSQRTRLRAFVARYMPTEVLVQSGKCSEVTSGVLRLLLPQSAMDELHGDEMPAAMKTLQMIRKAQYFGAPASPPLPDTEPESKWPPVLGAITRGMADQSSELVVSALGGALWQLRRSLIDHDIMSLGRFFAYVPTDELVKTDGNSQDSLISTTSNTQLSNELRSLPYEQRNPSQLVGDFEGSQPTVASTTTTESSGPRRMVLDEVSLSNLEVLVNNYDRTEAGSLWSFLNHSKTLPGRRLLRSWVSHPLFNPVDISRRAEAVEELLSVFPGEAEQWRQHLRHLPDLDRLLARVHSSGIKRTGKADHPDSRAVMFEPAIYAGRKIRDFADLLAGFERVSQVAEHTSTLDFKSSLLSMALHPQSDSSPDGRFPLDILRDQLAFFRSIFDERQARKDGAIRPLPGVNLEYDAAVAEVAELTAWFEETLRAAKRSTGLGESLRYFGSAKDRYQFEVPIARVSVVPASWFVKSQKKTHRRFWTSEIERQVSRLIAAEARVADAQRDTLRQIFAKFDAQRGVWSRVCSVVALLDSLLALAAVSASPGYCWPVVRERREGEPPVFNVHGGRHPMLEVALAKKGGSDFIANSLTLGGKSTLLETDEFSPRLLLLTGPNMGGKSTLLRQTCLLTILAQIGCKVPADSLEMTPVDRIFTRIGASDRILAGQSTFFVELAETAVILRNATVDSLCILDELGRGTATFDGTAIAHAVVSRLVSTTRCRCLFATHYHLLVTDWNVDPRVSLGHMDCLVAPAIGSTLSQDENRPKESSSASEEVTFLYKLCDGASPKSYGLNVARLAGLPQSVLELAEQQSRDFDVHCAATHGTNSSMFGLAAIDVVARTMGAYERLLSITRSDLSVKELAYVASEIWRRFASVGPQ